MAEPWSVAAPGVRVTRDDAVRVQVLRLRAADGAVLGRVGAMLQVPLPAQANRTDGTSPRALALAPGEFMLVDGNPTRDAAAIAAAHPATVHIADLTAGLVRYRITGPAARDLIAKGCSIDFHPRVFGPGRCAQTVLAQVFVIIDQVADDPVFHLFAEASYAHHLERWFDDAVVEFRAGSSADARGAGRDGAGRGE